MCWGLRQKELDFVELCEILDGTLWCFVGLAISMLTSTMEIRSRICRNCASWQWSYWAWVYSFYLVQRKGSLKDLKLVLWDEVIINEPVKKDPHVVVKYFIVLLKVSSTWKRVSYNNNARINLFHALCWHIVPKYNLPISLPQPYHNTKKYLSFVSVTVVDHF